MGLTTKVEMVNSPILHVEARVQTVNDNMIIRTDIVREEVTAWLVDNFAVLTLGQEIISFGYGFNSSHSQYLDSVKVMECSGPPIESGAYRLVDVNLDVQAYQLHAHEVDTGQLQDHTGDKVDDESPQSRIVPLPNKELDGIWESLLFDQPIPSNLLRAVSRMLAFSWRKLDAWTINWNRLILLYGPPGTGKTSLCRGLAQKLAIRLGRQFPQSKLVEINAHSLGSKFFSESGKLVAKMFSSVESMLDEEPDTLICVFIDEVETMTTKREQTLSGNDPLDAMRAVNSLLTALDRLRHHPNVVVLCTSNLIAALDAAFLDRIDIKQFIPPPSVKEIYEIFRSCLENLNQCGLIRGSTFDVVRTDPNDPNTRLNCVSQSSDCLLLPNYDEMLLWYQLFPESIPKQLADVAHVSVLMSNLKGFGLSQGLSGRSLRRIPALSLVLHTNYTTCTVEQALVALRQGVEDELKSNREASNST